ncbi:HAD hydrolase-like protein [Candidatus Peregrinibacteria bacterium]|nr:HAD hydrolase-like protein [Candidatus Peregrinibacteria bacterium]
MDKSREGITLEKIYQLFRLFPPKNTKTLARINTFSELDLVEINKGKSLNIKGIILDVDDCIAEDHKEILQKNIDHINKLLSQGFKIAIYSNMEKTSRYDSLDKRIIILTNLPEKPSLKGFKTALKALDLNANETVMVGDNYMTDGGAIREGIHFIKVKPIKSKYQGFPYRQKMAINGFLRSFYNGLSRFYEIW